MRMTLVCLGLLTATFAGCSGQSATAPQPNAVVAPASSASSTATTSTTLTGIATAAGGASVGGSHAAEPTKSEGGAPATVSGLAGVATTAPVATAVPAGTKGKLVGVVTSTPTQAAQNAVIYLENAPVEQVVDAKIDDVKMNFLPYVTVVTVGGTLTYVNKQPFPDSIFSTSNEKWDLGMIEAGGVRKRKFEKAGAYNLLCHLHPNQLGFIIVSPTSYFAKADKQGHFELSNVPAGTYEVVAWAPRVKLERKTVSVAAGDTTVDFELKR